VVVEEEEETRQWERWTASWQDACKLGCLRVHAGA
jgi:hypothetical protein